MTTPHPHLSHPKYRPDIDGLRAIAVLSVVTYHAFPDWMTGGFIGVDVFFVISGFLISTIIFENLNRGTFSFSEFYARRVRRIFPALIVVLIACFIYGWFVLLADEFNQLSKHIAAGAGYVSNLVLWSEAGYFDKTAETKPLLHLWSLGIEEQFYIVWPLVLWFAWKRKFNLFILAGLVALASFALNITEIKQDPVAVFYSPLTRFWELLSGTLLAWFFLYKRDSSIGVMGGFLPQFFHGDSRAEAGKVLASFCSICGLLALGFGFWKINKDLSFPGYWALLPVLGTTLVILAGPQAWINRTILSNKVVVWFGLISFPLYLWHWPILSFRRIIYFEEPPLKFKLIAIVASVLLAWLTVKLIEKPFRFGHERTGLKVTALTTILFAVGITGFIASRTDFSESRTFDNLSVERKGEHTVGSSLAWYRGKNDWLFLGDAYDNTITKLKLTNTPTESQIQATTETFSKIAVAGSKYNTKIVLIVGPNKSSVYPEYLPDELVPSAIKYSGYFLDRLKEITNLTVYDPTNDLLIQKESEGILYWMTDTHWNSKGAFLAYTGFSKLLNLPVPKVEFQHGSTHSGDLIEISKLKDFPLYAEDNFDVVFKDKPVWTEQKIPDGKETVFGVPSIVTNEKPLSTKSVWVVGDSFANILKQYFNATFAEVRYVGHWKHKLNDLPLELRRADRKPDIVVIIRVERTF